MAAARIVVRYLDRNHPIAPLITTLAQHFYARTPAFTPYQNLEAGVRQYDNWQDMEEGANVLVGVARFLAAHSPTERSEYQTADIARRLHRGGKIHETTPKTMDPAGG